MRKIEFQYFEGCPSYKQALSNLKEVLAELNIEVNLELKNIKNTEEAEKLKFYGSPTIKVNGMDLEGRTGDYSYNCRLYKIEGKLTGIPTIKYLRERILEINSKNSNSEIKDVVKQC